MLLPIVNGFRATSCRIYFLQRSNYDWSHIDAVKMMWRCLQKQEQQQQRKQQQQQQSRCSCSERVGRMHIAPKINIGWRTSRRQVPPAPPRSPPATTTLVLHCLPARRPDCFWFPYHSRCRCAAPSAAMTHYGRSLARRALLVATLINLHRSERTSSFSAA